MALYRRKSFTRDFREFFTRGLAVLLPSVLTLWILWQAFTFVFNHVARPINTGLREVVMRGLPSVAPADRLPDWFRVTDQQIQQFRNSVQPPARRDLSDEEIRHTLRRTFFREYWEEHWYLEATGLIVAIVLIYLAGLLLGGLIGRRLYARVEALIARIPGFKQVYPHVKQLVEMVMGDKPLAFKRVVMVQYPSEGIWTLGLVTSRAMRAVNEHAGKAYLTVFIPSTPTPFTGFAVHVAEDEVVDLPISIDEAIRFLLTGGVLVPDHQTGPGAAKAPGNIGNRTGTPGTEPIVGA